MRYLLIPVGSSGDVHPFVGMGLALQARGCDVTIVTNGHFGSLITRAGLDFVELGTAEEYEQTIANAELWHSSRGVRVVMEGVVSRVPAGYELLKSLCDEGPAVVAASPLAFGARIAQEKLGIPMATVHLQPSVFHSASAPAVQPPLPLASWAPRWWNAGLYRLVDRLVIDPMVGGRINAFRKGLGLPRVSRLLHGWWHSERLVIGMFPDWFAPPQPDWPGQVRLAGFPLWDERGVTELDPALTGFIDKVGPPIVFTPGSAMRFGKAFFQTAVEACERLGRPGVLLTRYGEQVPGSLPDSVRWFSFAPFSRLLPSCAALVHHGGIGTSSQGLAAGVPQLLMPMAFDQPDNAARLRRLGVAEALGPRRFKTRAVADHLDRLLISPEVKSSCERVAERMSQEDGITAACDLIESLAERTPGVVDSASD